MKHYVFDWGDTIMRDDPTRTDPMWLWPQVALMPGAEQVLSTLAQTSWVSLATNAASSDEAMIRQALMRVGVNQHFREVFCARRIGRKKQETEFWHHVLRTLEAKPDAVTVVGDDFSADVLVPASLGLNAVWVNRLTPERRQGDRYSTIHSLTELLDLRTSG